MRSYATRSGPSRSSQSAGLQKNAEGSVDLFFGPKAPAGKDGNWVPTNSERDFEVLFWLYGPEKSFFDKAWQLPDIVSQTPQVTDFSASQPPSDE